MTRMKNFLASAAELLGPRGLISDKEAMAPWLTDWRGRYQGRACAMALPVSTDQVAKLVALCSHHGVAIVPQGGNSGMSGGATPDQSGEALLLSLRCMTAIRNFDTDARQITCEAGVILQSLQEAASAEKLRFPLTFGGRGSATVGGLVSTNAGGTQVLRHGSMRSQVLGLEAVLASGDIFDALVPLKKDNRGFDLKQLLIGSEGTLGIVTAATLRLLPEIGGRVAAWVGMDDVRHARKLLLQLQDKLPESLESFEIMPAQAMAAVLEHLPNARLPLQKNHPWHALIELTFSGGEDDGLNHKIAGLLSEFLDDGIIGDATIAANETQAEAFWTLRDSISAAERALGPAMQHDISVPVPAMADFIAKAIPLVEAHFPGAKGAAFGHLGDGNVHFHVLAPEGAAPGKWESEQGPAVSRFVHDLVTSEGGSISAEHGIGQMKRDELGRTGDPVQLTMMRAVKGALDPHGILNPGKLVPVATERSNP
ncbi:FAD-binding oxidoreductase [Altererythrobacter sp. SALINAS58]|uniref:FAD-binding oxidoreductase n=1 Tax=Alteripontixanthobacter muriae TaxID=2705546 RepID=UPI001576FCD8|nr:FAD-binding oxidoreductase [Alteripontixanthobacter muriae]NTZ42986.1 FAD-binding oxidoreductase [Alteripontixanthobacter muriae]